MHELDSHALGTVLFDANGLIVAETDGRIVAFVHAGFGPDLPIESTRPLDLCREVGTISMLCVEPRLDDPELLAGLIDAAERYLRSQGAQVLYAAAIYFHSIPFTGVSMAGARELEFSPDMLRFTGCSVQVATSP